MLKKKIVSLVSVTFLFLSIGTSAFAIGNVGTASVTGNDISSTSPYVDGLGHYGTVSLSVTDGGARVAVYEKCTYQWVQAFDSFSVITKENESGTDGRAFIMENGCQYKADIYGIKVKSASVRLSNGF
ncbi:hypothetical protein [Paenibacillus chitinolyticus]|uniref:hypothetical protein n=1 Tax=Paenibacillus chitinolyticus TaxID=79263 RepID=UPI00366E4D61